MATKRNRKRKPSEPQGLFVPCSASYISHDELVFVEVMQGGESGKFFAFCGRCQSRVFLNRWERGWGFPLEQVEAPASEGGMGAVVDIPPAHRAKLEARSRKKIKKAAAAAARRS